MAEVFYLGSWKSLIEVEECLTLQELHLLVEESRNTELRRNRFLAALKGISLDGEESPKDDTPSFEQLKLRARAVATNQDPEKVEFDAIGIDME